MEGVEETNFQTFRDVLSIPLIEKSTTTPTKKARKARANSRRKTAIKPVSIEQDETNDAEELADFINYIANEVFINLPSQLRTLTYSTWLNSPSLQATYNNPLPLSTSALLINSLPPSITDSLTTYSILPSTTSTSDFLLPVLTSYITTITTTPPPPSLTKSSAEGCEICERTWIPLTYHHLIPRGVHAKVLKRGWHTEDKLQNVAWLCRACHSFVHRIASLEELAREWYSVERLLEREDVRSFASWVGKVRWKAQ